MKHNDYEDPEYARAYLAEADSIPFRKDGEGVLLSFIPEDVSRVLDLGTGDGRLIALLLSHCPKASFIGTDSSATMIEAASVKFSAIDRVEIVQHDLYDSIADFGRFDVVVSSFAIHHCSHERKKSLYEEIFNCLNPGGVFYNLEHVASPSEHLHKRFLSALGVRSEDEGNILLDPVAQIQWLREMGFIDVDIHWKWLELCLFGGVKGG